MARASKRWALIEDAKLRSIYLTGSTEEALAALPGRSWAAIQRRATFLKIIRRRPESRASRRVLHPVVTQLRAEREAQRLTRPELSDRAGYHVNTLLRFELGHAQPSLAIVVDWAGALGFEVVLRRRECAADVIPFPDKRRLMAGR